jgi:hypothetical protein
MTIKLMSKIHRLPRSGLFEPCSETHSVRLVVLGEGETGSEVLSHERFLFLCLDGLDDGSVD